MALDPLQLDPKALAQVAKIRDEANMWTALAAPFKKTNEAPKAESEMSPEELQAKFAGRELDTLQRSPDQNIEPGLQAEQYEMHMKSVAGGMDINTQGMTLEQVTDAVQAAHDRGGVAPEEQQIGENYMTNFVVGDIAAGQSCSMADVEASSPTCPDARTVDQEQITI